jgi:hypothetical protein
MFVVKLTILQNFRTPITTSGQFLINTFLTLEFNIMATLATMFYLGKKLIFFIMVLVGMTVVSKTVKAN